MSLAVKVRVGDAVHNLVTLNVSVDGAFVVMPDPPGRGQLVHLTFILPTSREPVVVQGMVVRTVRGEAAREHMIPAGMGIQYYGLGASSRAAWEDFFHSALEQHIARGGELHPPIPPVRHELSQPTPVPLRAKPAAQAPEPATPIFENDAEWKAAAEAEATAAPVAPKRAAPAQAAMVVRQPAALAPRPSGRRGWPGRDDLLVEVSLAPVSQAHQTEAAYQPVLYRISPPDIQGLIRFRQEALERGGVAVAGIGRREPGSLAVVSVVHPLTKAEFHVPGEVHRSKPRQSLVPIKFFGVTSRTKQEFESFIESGGRPASPAGQDAPVVADSREMVLFESADEAQRDLAQSSKGAVLLGVMLPLEAALDPFKGRR